jgi:hypothetical protein
LGFGVWGLGFGVWGLGFGFEGLGFRFRVGGSGLIGFEVLAASGLEVGLCGFGPWQGSGVASIKLGVLVFGA